MVFLRIQQQVLPLKSQINALQLFLLGEAQEIELRSGEIVHDFLVESVIVVLAVFSLVELWEGCVHDIICKVTDKLQVELRLISVQI